MSDVSFKWVGSEKLATALLKRAGLKIPKQLIKKHTAQLEEREKLFMGQGGVYVKGYSQQENRKHTNLSIENDGLTGKVTTNTEHIVYIEHGTRYMAAEPAIKPAFDRQKQLFKAEIKSIVK